jgi:hypothetical protein
VPEAAVDRIAVYVACDDQGYRRAESILREAGAGDIRRIEEGRT